TFGSDPARAPGIVERDKRRLKNSIRFPEAGRMIRIAIDFDETMVLSGDDDPDSPSGNAKRGSVKSPLVDSASDEIPAGHPGTGGKSHQCRRSGNLLQEFPAAQLV